MNYNDYLNSKEFNPVNSGFDAGVLNKNLFEWQEVLTRWAVKKGRCALFEDCGLGKSIQFLSWADAVHTNTGKDVIIFSPLGVSYQTVREGEKFGVNVTRCESMADVKPGVNITNYERVDKFDADAFVGCVLDESSIIKDQSGKFRNRLIESYRETPYKLCCSATPSPNNYQELGNQAEFLNVMTMPEMLSMFFVNDSGDTTSNWRLKGHVKSNVFWEWLSTWCVMIRKPSDIGFDDDGYNLPPLKYNTHIIPYGGDRETLFVEPVKTLSDIRKSMKETMPSRVSKCKDIVTDDGPWSVWCSLNDESARLTKTLVATEVKGADKPAYKEQTFIDFADNKVPCLVTKPKIAMYGLNWQNCNNVIVTGLTHSYEQFYQLVRRFWRFGQKKQVNVHIVIGEREKEVLNAVLRKEQDMADMFDGMIEHMKLLTIAEIKNTYHVSDEYNPTIEMELPAFIGGIS